MTKKYTDPVIDEIREVRSEISARCDHNPEKLVQYYMKLQEQYKDRLINDDKPVNNKNKSKPQ